MVERQALFQTCLRCHLNWSSKHLSEWLKVTKLVSDREDLNMHSEFIVRAFNYYPRTRHFMIFLLSCFFIFYFLKSWNCETKDKYVSGRRALTYNIFLLFSYYFLSGHICNQVIVSNNKYIVLGICQYYCLKCILCFSSFNSQNSTMR